MNQASRSYIAHSPLTFFILGVAQTHDRGIRSLTIEFAENTTTGCNWRVASVDAGIVDSGKANAIVAKVMKHNTHWVMVKDGSDLDGHVVANSPSS